MVRLSWGSKLKYYYTRSNPKDSDCSVAVTTERKFLDSLILQKQKFQGTKGPRAQKFHGVKFEKNKKSMELLLSGPFVPCVDFLLPETKSHECKKLIL